MGSLTTEAMRSFDENFKRVGEEIARAAEKAGRDPREVSLLAATKTVPAETIQYAISQGLFHIGENRVQELLDKYGALERRPATCSLSGGCKPTR